MDDTFFYKDELFQAAFRLRDEEPWMEIDENDIFHFLASSGKDYYCMVTGFAGQHLALTLYRGLKGYSSRQYFTDRYSEKAKRDPYVLCSQDCIQVSIEDKKEDVPPEVLKDERAYAKRQGFRLGRKNRYCAFLDYRPEYLPDALYYEDQDDLLEGLEMLFFLLEKMKGGEAMENLGFVRGRTAPHLEKKDGAIVLSDIDYPVFLKDEWPVGKVDDFSCASVKNHPKSYSVSMRVSYIPMPTFDMEEARPMIPASLLVISNKDGQIFPIMPEGSYRNNPDEFVMDIHDAFESLGVYPKYINVDDDRTEALLQDFSKRTGIPLMRVPQIRDIDDILDQFFEELENLPDFNDYSDEDLGVLGEEEQMAALIEALRGLEDDEIRNMPLDLKKGVLDLMNTPLLPVDLKSRLKSLL